VTLSTETFDVIVIGLGALGAATLRPLAQAGVRVLGIDRHSPPHDQGSSHGDSRITRLAIGEGDAYVPLVQRSHAIWRALEAATGRRLYEATGGLVLSTSSGAAAHHGKPDFLRRTIASAQRFAIAHEVLDAAEIRRRFPQFALQGDEIGYWEPEAGFVRPEEAISAQLEVARKVGARIHTGETVQGLETQADGTTLVVTDQGRYATRQVVVATGAWLPEFLGQQAQAEWTRDFQVYRQVMYWFDTGAASADFAPERFPIFIWMFGDGEEDYVYGFPSSDPTQPALKVATEQYSSPTSPEALQREVSADEIAAMYASRVQGRFPQIAGHATKARACMYTVTPDRDFVVDTLDEAGKVWIVSACSGHGFKHSAGLGEAIADRLRGVGDDEVLAPFRRRVAAPVAAGLSNSAR
jgi:sarcosine oxidase